MLDCDNPFWKFSLAVYAAPGVTAECLALQSALNIDVNLLLFGAWLGATKNIILDETNLAAVDAYVRQGRATVVHPMRSVRQQVKTMPEMRRDAVADRRHDIAAAELCAEQIEQAFLFEFACELAAVAATAQDAVRANVTAMLQRKMPAAAVAPPRGAQPALLIATALAYRSEIA